MVDKQQNRSLSTKEYLLVKQKPFTSSHSPCVFANAKCITPRSCVWERAHTHTQPATIQSKNQVLSWCSKEGGREEGVIHPFRGGSEKARRGGLKLQEGLQLWNKTHVGRIPDLPFSKNLGHDFYFYFCVSLNTYGQFYTIL